MSKKEQDELGAVLKFQRGEVDLPMKPSLARKIAWQILVRQGPVYHLIQFIWERVLKLLVRFDSSDKFFQKM